MPRPPSSFNPPKVREMKKYILIASAALLAMAACTKVQEAETLQQEISFQVANHVQTKADAANVPASPVKFTGKDFGVYSWHHDGEAVAPVMENEQVGLKGDEWRTLNNTYYWFKTGTMNFVSYAPFQATGGPAVTEKSIAYSAVTVSDVDLMYADRAQDMSANIKTYNVNGVPTLFRHALAKLSFRVKVNFTEWTTQVENPQTPAATNGADAAGAAETMDSKTTWEVTLYNITLKNHFETGDLTLNLDRDGTSWVADGGTWRPDTRKAAKDVVLFNDEKGKVLTTTPMDLYTDKDGKAQSFFVLPQVLVKDAQKLSLKFHIKTTQPNKDEQGNNIVQEEDIETTLDLMDISSLPAWGMNQNIFYTICIKPTAAIDPNTPDNPTDAIITFDPSLMDWEVIDAEAFIQL